MPNQRIARGLLLIALVSLLSLFAVPADAARPHWLVSASFHRPTPQAPTVGTSTNPVAVAVNAATRTAYVAAADGVDIIDISRCTARVSTGCGQAVAKVTSGVDNFDVAIDRVTHTVYVTSAGNDTVWLFGGQRCNARDISGCGRDTRTVKVGTNPNQLAVDSGSQTVYAANAGADFSGDTVSMIDGRTCNALVSTGCSDAPATVTVGTGPQGMAVDTKSKTLYVTNLLSDTVSVVNTRTCNSRSQIGCNSVVAVSVVVEPGVAVVDRVSQTLYVAGGASDELGAVSMVDASACNAQNATGCSRVAPTAAIGSVPIGIATDPGTRTLYVANQEDSAVSVIDETRCNAHRTDGCRAVPPTMSGGFDTGGVAVDPRTHTVYLTSQNEDTLTVLDGSRCNGRTHVGCAVRAPTTPTGKGAAGLTVDTSTHTIYVPNQLEDTVSVIDARACNARNLIRCSQNWPKISVGAFPKEIAIDHATHTAYVSNYEGKTVSVIDISHCNAHTTTGCGDKPMEIAVPGKAYTLSLDPASHTVYVPEVDDGQLAIINGATCNATDHSGCADKPHTVPVSGQPAGVIVDARTATIYVSGRSDGIVSVLNAGTCNGAVRSGCGVIATTPVGATPRFMAINDRAQTLYVSNKDSDSVSMIDMRTCSARNTSRCGQPAPAVSVGHLPFGVAVDQRAQRLYVGEVADSTVSQLNARTCNAIDQRGCGSRLVVNTGSWPTNVVVDPTTRSVYISNNVDAQLSIARETHTCT
jgi:YVTN family beta-propeller protein